MRVYLVAFGAVALVVVGLLLLGSDLYDSLALVTLFLPVAAWGSVVILWRAWRLRPSPVVYERLIVATRDAAVATLVAVLALRRLLRLEAALPAETAAVLSVVALLAVCVYPIRLLWWYWRGDFD